MAGNQKMRQMGSDQEGENNINIFLNSCLVPGLYIRILLISPPIISVYKLSDETKNGIVTY